MRQDDYNNLKEMISEFRQELDKIENKLRTDRDRILDIDARLQVFRDAEPEDVRVFSPRSLEISHREEIEQIKAEKRTREDRERELTLKKEFLTGYIKKMRAILRHQDQEKAQEKQPAEELQASSIQNLDQLVHKIEQSSAMIVTNPIQAKQDLAVIGQKLKETVDQMRDTVWVR